MARIIGLLSVLLIATSSFSVPIALGLYSYTFPVGEPIPVMRQGVTLPIGAMIQVIRDGGNGQIDLPDGSGVPGGDDLLNSTFSIGAGTDTIGTFGFTATGFSTQSDRVNERTICFGDRFYLRIWCGEQTSVPVTRTPVPEHSLWAVGTMYQCPSSDFDYWNVEMTPSSQSPQWTDISGSSVSEPGTALPVNFAMSAFPNPFNATTTIQFDLPKAGAVRLDIVNAAGQAVSTLLNQSTLAAGSHSLLWRAEAFPAGVYFVRCQSPLGSMQTKLILLK